MRISGTVDKLKYDSEAHFQAIRDALIKQFRKAARAFVRAAYPRIPVETGMARGAFLDIGKFLNIVIPISPTKFNKFYYGTAIRLPKTAETGAALTTQPEKIFNFDDNKFKFEISSRIFHLNLLDIASVNGSGPWQSFEAGSVAFRAEMRKLKLPKLKSFVTRTRVSLGKNAGVTVEFKPLRKQETSSG